MRGKGAQGYYWVSRHVVRIFCEVMSHSAINRSVDKVSALRGSIDTRESITNLPRGHFTLSTDLLCSAKLLRF